MVWRRNAYILKYRSKIMLLYGMTGACIAGLPLVFVLIFLIGTNMRLEQQVLSYKEWERQGLYLNVWTLKEDIVAGEKITRAHLEKKKTWVFDSEISDLTMEIHQIAGYKAKTILKKGTVIKSESIYHKKHKNNKKET